MTQQCTKSHIGGSCKRAIFPIGDLGGHCHGSGNRSWWHQGHRNQIFRNIGQGISQFGKKQSKFSYLRIFLESFPTIAFSFWKVQLHARFGQKFLIWAKVSLIFLFVLSCLNGWFLARSAKRWKTLFFAQIVLLPHGYRYSPQTEVTAPETLLLQRSSQ